MFKKFKSLFVIEEGATSPDSQSSTATKEKTGAESPGTSSFQVPSTTAGPGQVQEKFLDVLFGALSSSNQEGFDYMEFKDFLKSLANVPMDDSTRYKSAYATAQTMGATKDKILSSARHYVSILAAEQAKFQEALEGQKKRNLTGKHDEIKKLEHSIQQKEKDIEKLKSDIESHRQQITTLEKEIGVASDKLIQTASDFDATYRALLEQIEADVKNIESHL